MCRVVCDFPLLIYVSFIRSKLHTDRHDRVLISLNKSDYKVYAHIVKRNYILSGMLFTNM
jgi:hypothetical protein